MYRERVKVKMPWKLQQIRPCPMKTKKHQAVFRLVGSTVTKKVCFGALGLTDYTRGASDAQRTAYRQRHRSDLQMKDPLSPGYLSYYILWGPTRSLNQNVSLYRKRFHL